MKQLVRNAIDHPLISGSAIIFIGSNAGNVFNLLFNFFMVRNLSDSDFGILTSLNSVIMLPLLVSTALMPIVVNFAAGYFAQKKIRFSTWVIYYTCEILLFLLHRASCSFSPVDTCYSLLFPY